ncbi:type II toxin-antitoxin system YafQ family toxin [Leptotrichia trevisanii]|uniref:type II toxin-antitoxin system YafQ family toxin n=1 Tax=Leptotrichia trevisanii TaxID=109328 RepID=UPI0026ECBCF4|nr:type II toxin-antitoxin system YafQ family toxin [Leptotrichia trevisanii]
MKLTIKTTKRFDKDLKKLKKRKYDLILLAQVINKLSDSEILPEKYRDHYLAGDYKGFRECRIQPDWLLIYKIEKNILVLMLSGMETHLDLF